MFRVLSLSYEMQAREYHNVQDKSDACCFPQIKLTVLNRYDYYTGTPCRFPGHFMYTGGLNELNSLRRY